MIERLQNNSSIIIAGHRGYKASYPENTLLAFQKAIESGVDMLEFDLRLSKDQVVMVMHDETLDRTTNGKGKLSNYTMNELKQLDAGKWFDQVFEGLKIPTLEEVCILLKSYPEVLLNVEIKKSIHAQEVVDKAVSMLTEYGYISKCVFTSFDAEIISYIHDTYNLKTQGFPEEVMFNFVPGIEGTYSKMWGVAISMDLLRPKLVEQFKNMGLVVSCYCPNNYKQVYYALGCGVTILTCDSLEPSMHIRRHLESQESFDHLEREK